MQQLLVMLVMSVSILSVASDTSYEAKHKRLAGDYEIDQYANEESLNPDNSNEIEPERALLETIPGEPKRDYPTYKSIPKTGFSCKGRVNWGYYADVETECQVFHVCESEYSKISFLCPVGSAFNQKHLVCDWWYNFDCHDEISLTSLYDDYDLGRVGANHADGPDGPDGLGDRRRQRQDDDRNHRSGEKTLAKRRGGDYRYEDEEYDNDGLYDLNLVSSGGNI